MLACVFLKQFWHGLLGVAGLHDLVSYTEASFEYWWRLSSQHVEGLAMKGFKSLVILGAWCIWKHRNRCVLDGSPPSMAAALLLAR
jgi:hypothetical protein